MSVRGAVQTALDARPVHDRPTVPCPGSCDLGLMAHTADFDVIIIGSGVAGLNAAATLRETFGRRNIVVLEAADYVGG